MEMENEQDTRLETGRHDFMITKTKRRVGVPQADLQVRLHQFLSGVRGEAYFGILKTLPSWVDVVEIISSIEIHTKTPGSCRDEFCSKGN